MHVASVHSTSSYWPIAGMMEWGVIEYTSWSPLVRIDSTLNSGHYISVMLRPVALSFIQIPTKRYVLSGHGSIPCYWYCSYLPWNRKCSAAGFAHSPDLLHIENFWLIVAKRLARLYTPVTIVCELWHFIEAAWAEHAASYCICTCHPNSVRLKAQTYNNCYCCQRLLF